ncbi:MAG: hypothetical protein U0172_11960 [Nitrospiraceae bacterium]
MKPVVQLDRTGCGIAAAAAISGRTYREVKRKAAGIGVFAEDPRLWSDSEPICKVLATFGNKVENRRRPFTGWDALPALALLATKWHLEQGRPFWHWAVFVRDGDESYVLDSKRSLRSHRRTDFGRIKPKWFLRVSDQARSR